MSGAPAHGAERLHLDWHYAVDGYVSAIVVLLLWAASGPLLRWYFAATGVRD